ncbi:hypothetical protein ACLKA7_015405 [Drosophila subpalustris]
MIHNQKFNLAFILLIAVTISTHVTADDCCKPGETKPDPGDCAKYFVCCTGEFKPMSCLNGEYFNADLGKCVKDNGECKCNGTTCVDGDKKADTSNCANYLLCINGEYQTVSCGSGNYWNVQAKQCQKDNGICVTTPAPTTPIPTTPKPTTPKPTTPAPTTPTPTTPCPSTPTTPVPTTPKPTTPTPTTPKPTTPAPTTPTPTTPCPSTPTTPVPTTPKPTTPTPTTPKPTTPAPTTPTPTTPCSSTPTTPVPTTPKPTTPTPTTPKPTTPAPTTPTPTTPCSTTCVEGNVKEDPSNCAGFYQCISGKYVAQVCSSGNYWNAVTKQCEKDNGYCVTTPAPTTPIPTTPKPTTPAPTTPTPTTPTPTTPCSSTPTTPVPTTPKPTTPKPTTQCPSTPTPTTPCSTTCVEGNVKEDPSNCAGFYQCISGKYVAQVCSSGNYWNAVTKQCEKDNGYCVTTPTPSTPTPATCVEGDVKENPSNCAGFYQCISGKYVAQVCSSGNYWNAVTKQCEKDNGYCVTTPTPSTPTPTPSTTTPATCVEGDVKENPSNCAGFYQCISGKYVAQVCSSGNYWNAVTKQCEKDNGYCVTTPTPSTPTPATCVEGDVKENPSNCAGFYQCISGKYVAQVCSSGNYWNAVTKQCEKDNGYCVTTPTTPSTPTPQNCVEGDKEVNPANCAGYLECINNVMVKRQCPANTYFDDSLSVCVIDVDGICIPKVCDPECCDRPNDWLGSVDKNCSAFIQCLYGNKYQQRCPNNLQFNSVTKECDFPENVQCDDGTAPPSGPTAGPSGTYCESKGRCVGKSDGAMMADATDVCSGSYVVCQCECEVNFKCSAGLVFNTKIRSCDWPANANC